jgi:hypothetical protein
MDNINSYLDKSVSSGATPAPKFALFSGHDTTIMPLLASLDPGLWNDTDWAPYASMVLIEVRFRPSKTFSPALFTVIAFFSYYFDVADSRAD